MLVSRLLARESAEKKGECVEANGPVSRSIEGWEASLFLCILLSLLLVSLLSEHRERRKRQRASS